MTREERIRTLAMRGLDFEDAALVFEGLTVEVEDTRRDYGEVEDHLLGLPGGSPGCRSGTRRAATIVTYSA